MQHQQAAKTSAPPQQQHTLPAGSPQHDASPPAHSLLQLQQAYGNTALANLLNSHIIQAKLTINQPGDKYEQEADRITEMVMRMPEPGAVKGISHVGQGVQRQCAACASGKGKCSKCAEEEEKIQRKPLAASITPLVQRHESNAATPVVTPQIASQINALRGGGQPLSESSRTFFEPRFGADFNGVRVHTGGQAAEMSRSIQAKAFTYGSDIYFNSGQYAPESSEGKRLLAHELGHVVQQGGNLQSIFREDSAEDYREKEAITEIEENLFRVFYSQGFSSGNGIPGVIKEAEPIHDKIGKVLPRLQVKYAELLLDTYEELKELEKKSMRDDNGSLLYQGAFGIEPWTEEHPKKVEDIPTFSPQNVLFWKQTVLEQIADNSRIVEKSSGHMYGPMISLPVEINSKEDYDRLDYFIGLLFNESTNPKISIEKGIEIVRRWKHLFRFYGWVAARGGTMSRREFKEYIGKELPVGLYKEELATISSEENIKFKLSIQVQLDAILKKRSNESKHQMWLAEQESYRGGIWEDVTGKVRIESNDDIETFVRIKQHEYNEHCQKRYKCVADQARGKRIPRITYPRESGYEFVGNSPWPHPHTLPYEGHLYLTPDRTKVWHRADDRFRKDEIVGVFASRVFRDTQGANLIAKYGPWAAVSVLAGVAAGPAIVSASLSGGRAAPIFAASNLQRAEALAGLAFGKVVQIGESGFKEWVEGLTTPEGLGGELLDVFDVWSSGRGRSNRQGKTNTDIADAPPNSSIPPKTTAPTTIAKPPKVLAPEEPPKVPLRTQATETHPPAGPEKPAASPLSPNRENKPEGRTASGEKERGSSDGGNSGGGGPTGGTSGGSSSDVPSRVRTRINIRKDTITKSDVPGRAPGRVSPVNKGWDYAWRRHGGGNQASQYPNRSQFILSREIVETLLQNHRRILDAPVRRSFFSNQFIREVDLDFDVGNLPVNKGGKSTKTITVITDDWGNLVNTYPGPANKSDLI